MEADSFGAHRFGAEDYLLFLRCPRLLHRKLCGTWTEVEPQFPIRSDRDEVHEVARNRRSLPSGHVIDRLITAPPFAAAVDVWHPQRPQGMAAVIVREATSLKQAYLIESAFIRYCAEKSGEMITRQFVHYLRDRLDALRAALATDPILDRYREETCSRPHACPVCSAGTTPVGDDHITTLYRGGELARQLLAEGYETLTVVPEERLPHPRQRIQQRTVLRGRPHIDTDALHRFLESISYPLCYLDFEAVSSAVPRYSNTHPWEHVPYLFSVHTEDAPGVQPTHQWFFMDPHHDERHELVTSLLNALGGDGTVLVYGAAFEAGIFSRLAEIFPGDSAAIENIASRMADLLQPFNEFAYYHPSQRGKVKLKTVLPILTGDDYSDLVVKDGYTANFAYRYLSSAEDTAAEDTGAEDTGRGYGLDDSDSSAAIVVDDLVQYCTMDTLAMVRIMAALRRIVSRL